MKSQPVARSNDDQPLHRSLAEAPPERRVGDRVHGCRLVEKLGEGGFGEAWLAEAQDGSRLVLKFPVSLRGADAIIALRREVEVFERLSAEFDPADPPPITPLLEDLLDRDPPALAMAYMAGGDLRRYMRVQGGAVPVASANRIVGDILAALEFAHARGVSHRDLSPENVLFDNADYRWKVSDFGLARVALQNDLSLERSGRSTQASAAIAGKLHYMAPEVAAGSGAAGPEADIYSLGVLWAQMLTGEGDAGLPAHWHADIADQRSRDWIADCLRRAPASRPSAAEMLRPSRPPLSARGRWPGAEGAGLPSPDVTLRGVIKAFSAMFALVAAFALLAFIGSWNNSRREEERRERFLAKSASPAPRPAKTPKPPAPRPLLVTPLGVRQPELAWSNKDSGVVAAPWNAGSEVGERRTLPIADGVELAFRWVPDVVTGPGFWIAEKETNVALWTLFAAETDLRTLSEKRAATRQGRDIYPYFTTWLEPGHEQTPNHPVVNMTAAEAADFCDWLSKRSGARASLPTLSQWLAAAEFTRLPDVRMQELVGRARHSGTGKPQGPWAVGSLSRDALGLFDFAGNVAEWCVVERLRNGQFRTARMGGSWLSSHAAKWSSVHDRSTDGGFANTVGFRVVIQTGEAGRE